MTAELLLTQFERIEGAPDAVPTIRRWVFDMATRGRLTEQYPGDEPAVDLLDRCRAQIGQLSRRRNSSVVNPPVQSASGPLPPGWASAPLGITGRIFNGNSVSESGKAELAQVQDGLPFIATKDVGYGREQLNYDNGLRVARGTPGFKPAQPDAILICSEGGSAGRKLGITDREICFGNKLYANEAWPGINPRYLLSLYQGAYFYAAFRKRMTGIIGGIALSEFLQIPVPIPPSAEQDRIVEKVDQLMVLCDELEAAQNEREARRNLLRTASLRTLVDSVEPRIRTQFFLRNASRMIAKPEHVAGMRQAILSLAVRGRLVAQDAADEPAALLVDSVVSRRANVTRSRARAAAEPDYRMDVYPASWAITSVGALFDVFVGSTPSRTDLSLWGGEVPWVSSGEVAFNRIRSTRETITSKALRGSADRLHPPGTVMLSMIGQGKTRGQAAILEISAAHNQNCASIRVSDTPIVPEYIYLMLAERYERTRLQAEGGSQPALNKAKVCAIRFGLPPLPEQHRIVAKVAELMAVANDLEQSLATEQAGRARLLEALLRDALEDGGARR